MKKNTLLLCLCLAFLLTACGADLPGEPLAAPPAGNGGALFTDVTAAAGLFRTRQGTEKLIGQTWGDIDNDGWLDLYVTDNAGPNRLYHNDGDGTFSISAFANQVTLTEAVSSGAVFADFDNDGWIDLYVLNVGADVLFHNTGTDGFVDVTETAGVGDTGHGKTAAWGDFNEDGWLDLYVANWSCSPSCGRPNEGDKDRLYQNNGDGTFSDVTDLLSSKVRGAGFVANFNDYDNDGDLDIYLVNDEFINPVGNALWRNDGPGCDGWCFTDVSAAAGADTRVMGMGLASSDYDNDGDLDYYFSNAGPMVMLQNQGDGTFADVAGAAGVALGPDAVGWGAVFFDYDNDGWRDLYLAVSDLLDSPAPLNALFRNDGSGGFTDLRDTGLAHGGRTIGVAYADYDNDGWVDLLIGNFDSGYVLYHNEGNADNHRLVISLTGGGPVNRDAVGARVYLTVGDRIQMQEVTCGSSLGAGNALDLYFGLGLAEQADAIRIVWPDGTEQTYANMAADRHYHFVYGEA